MKAGVLVVVSGLPASGKTTVGRVLNERLSMPLIDKDAILVNWWDHDTSPTRLREIASSLVEVFCDCPVEVASARFEARRRHPGHHDADRSPEEIEAGVRRLSDSFRGPLGVGDLIRIDTNAPLDADAVTGLVRSALVEVVPLADFSRQP